MQDNSQPANDRVGVARVIWACLLAEPSTPWILGMMAWLSASLVWSQWFGCDFLRGATDVTVGVAWCMSWVFAFLGKRAIPDDVIKHSDKLAHAAARVCFALHPLVFMWLRLVLSGAIPVRTAVDYAVASTGAFTLSWLVMAFLSIAMVACLKEASNLKQYATQRYAQTRDDLIRSV